MSDEAVNIRSGSSGSSGDTSVHSDDVTVFIVLSLSTLAFGFYYSVIVYKVPPKKDSPYRERFTAFTSNSALGTMLDIINAIYSFVSCVFFIWDTYLPKGQPMWMFAMEVRV